jgi:hypothetical protein
MSTTPWRRMEQRRYSSTSLDLCTRWLWVVRITPRPLYPRGKSPWYPLGRRLSGPRACLYAVGRRKISFPPAGNQTPAVQLVALRYKGFIDKFLEFIYESRWERTSLGLLYVKYVCIMDFYIWSSECVFSPPLCRLFCSPILSIWQHGIMNDYEAESWHFWSFWSLLMPFHLDDLDPRLWSVEAWCKRWKPRWKPCKRQVWEGVGWCLVYCNGNGSMFLEELFCIL